MLLCLVLIKLLQQSVLSICASASTRITNTVTARLKQQTYQSTKENTAFTHKQYTVVVSFLIVLQCVSVNGRSVNNYVLQQAKARHSALFSRPCCFFSSLSYLRSVLHCPYTAMFLQVGWLLQSNAIAAVFAQRDCFCSVLCSVCFRFVLSCSLSVCRTLLRAAAGVAASTTTTTTAASIINEVLLTRHKE
jgi:hypothetical protein